MIIISNAFSLIKCITSFFSKTLININVLFFSFHYINLFLIKKFERFKKRMRFELEIAIRDILFK